MAFYKNSYNFEIVNGMFLLNPLQKPKATFLLFNLKRNPVSWCTKAKLLKKKKNVYLSNIDGFGLILLLID